MIEKIKHDGELLALIVRESYNKEGVNFITEEKDSFQLAIHNVKKGKRYRAHSGKSFEKIENFPANKIYYIQKGCVGIDFYSSSKSKVAYASLKEGDMVLFLSGGHGVDIMEDSKMIEIKQGPYRGVDGDKLFLE